ncbi:hypothetical protein DH2020_031317 [Rehmannia glutinosa]|uniref:ATPase AAA-type core domain-containing protein n=1 Tax=Rehmannia glutinosa TaxID=99300 RepID=A0ABR0VLF5_REHGL
MARYGDETERLVDQDRVIDEIFESVRDEMMRPKGSFLLLVNARLQGYRGAFVLRRRARLVEIDMSEYEVPRLEGSASPDYLSLRRRVRICGIVSRRLSENVRIRYSLGKIDKAPFAVTGVPPRVLCNVASRDVNGNRVDFSKSIIFMTSSVGVDHETRNRDLKDDVRKFFGPNCLPKAEETSTIKNIWRSLQTDTTTDVAKVIASIINAVVKIVDSPLHLPELPAKHYLFLGLDDDAKRGLVNVLTDSLTTSSGKSLFAHVELENNSNGELQKTLLIEQVKQCPCMVLMFDGVEFADDVLYKSLLEIFDKGTLDDDEGLVVDFRRTIVILTSDSANKHNIAKCFRYPKMHVLRNVAMNQNTKRFRTELLRRVDEITVFDPLISENGRVKRIHKSAHGLKSTTRLLLGVV